MAQSANPSGDYNALLKLFATVLRQQGGIVKLSAADIHDTEPPQGFTKRWDNDEKCLIIELIQHGTALYITNDGKVEREREVTEQWTPPAQAAPQVQMSPQIIESIAREHQLLQQDRSQKLEPPRHIFLDNERQADLERQRTMRQAVKEITDYQPPTPATEVDRNQQSRQQRLSPLTPSSTQQQEPTNLRVPQEFFRESVRDLSKRGR